MFWIPTRVWKVYLMIRWFVSNPILFAMFFKCCQRFLSESLVKKLHLDFPPTFAKHLLRFCHGWRRLWFWAQHFFGAADRTDGRAYLVFLAWWWKNTWSSYEFQRSPFKLGFPLVVSKKFWFSPLLGKKDVLGRNHQLVSCATCLRKLPGFRTQLKNLWWFWEPKNENPLRCGGLNPGFYIPQAEKWT